MLQEKKGREFELHENTKQDKNKVRSWKWYEGLFVIP